MPALPGRTVRCANCDREQADRGKRATCSNCGCQPLPSYKYPRDSGFYPRLRPEEDQQRRIERLVAQRRGR
jgi:hypothetical protein